LRSLEAGSGWIIGWVLSLALDGQKGEAYKLGDEMEADGEGSSWLLWDL
jgi:hypothetical protein